MNNQKGFTIVELLIGMVILSIVTAALTGFIVSSSKSYAASNTEIVVQQESQLAMNQISDVIIDTTRSVNYVGYTADGSDSEQVLKDADFTKDIEDKCLTIYNGEGKIKLDADGNQVKDAEGNLVFEAATDEDGNFLGNGNKNYQIYYDKDEERLYFSEAELSSLSFPESDRVVLAEFVKDFNVDLSQVEEKRVVSISIEYEYNNRVFKTSNNITIRNKVLVNNIDLEVNRSVELKIRLKDPLVTLEPNEDYRFSTPIFEGKNIIDKSVTWSIVPDTENTANNPTAADTVFTDEKNGVIHISSAEMAASFKVQVTTNAVDSSGEHGTATAIVHVKRVTDIDFSKIDSVAENQPNEISAGSEITIIATASGNPYLGVTCDKCGDPVTIDKYVVKDEKPAYVWQITRNDGNICTMTSSDHGKAMFTIAAGAQPGQKVTIQATSLLSVEGNDYNRLYASPGALSTLAPVTKSITLEVKDNKEANISVGGPIRYGYSSPIGINVPGFNKAGQGYYIVCARIRPVDAAASEQDKIMLYGTNGSDTWLTPDLFALDDMDKTYNISIQLIDPQAHFNVGDALVTDVVNDYIANCDATGTYRGKYPSSDKVTVQLNPPLITYEYKGDDYTDSPLNIDTMYAVKAAANAGEKMVQYVKSLSNARPEAVQGIRYNVYRQENGEWKLMYGFDESGNYNIGNSQYGAMTIKPRSDAAVEISLDQNNTMNAVGNYRCVPYVTYTHTPNADHSFNVYWANYNYKDQYYKLQTYKRENSTINITVAGGNMSDLVVYAENSLRKGVTYFPLPTDTSWSGFTKYFNLGDTSLQHYKNEVWLKLYEDGSSSGKSFKLSDITCRYIASEGSYEIEFFAQYYDSFWNRDVELSAGKFKWYPGGSEWTKIERGQLDEQYKNGNTTQIKTNGNAQIKMFSMDKAVYAYLPLPSDSAFTSTDNGTFGFNLDTIKSGKTQEVTPNNLWIGYMNKTTDNQATWDIQCTNAICSYDAATATYTLTITCKKNGENQETEMILTIKEGTRSWEFKSSKQIEKQ
ncbi:MAG: prepilin-type N-terminal cleavage/methylation domain-containing protein [Clostridiales bacterium]|nr:prepilin-type N-terminal cleavage/methylation domain-containing protein [Clostridiales bacterium]